MNPHIAISSPPHSFEVYFYWLLIISVICQFNPRFHFLWLLNKMKLNHKTITDQLVVIYRSTMTTFLHYYFYHLLLKSLLNFPDAGMYWHIFGMKLPKVDVFFDCFYIWNFQIRKNQRNNQNREEHWPEFITYVLIRLFYFY